MELSQNEKDILQKLLLDEIGKVNNIYLKSNYKDLDNRLQRELKEYRTLLLKVMKG